MTNVLDKYGKSIKQGDFIIFPQFNYLNEKIVLYETPKSLVVSRYTRSKDSTTSSVDTSYESRIEEIGLRIGNCDFHNDKFYICKDKIKKNNIMKIEPREIPEQVKKLMK